MVSTTAFHTNCFDLSLFQKIFVFYIHNFVSVIVISVHALVFFINCFRFSSFRLCTVLITFCWFLFCLTVVVTHGLSAKDGDSTTMVCELEGYTPYDGLFWYKDGKQIPSYSEDDKQKFVINNINHSLTVNKIGESWI